MIQKMISHYKQLLSELINNPHGSVGKIDYLRDEEKLIIEDKFNDDFTGYSDGKSIVDLFISQVNKTPNNIAVAFKDIKITYRELDAESNRLANYLVQSHNVLNGDFVGLMLERSEFLIISILGILKTGAAYVPIDTNYPEQRKDYIKKDSQCKVIIDETLLKQFTTEIESCSSAKPQIGKTKLSDVMYVIYTSGTTGNPKGVMIEHKSVMNLIASQTQCFNIDETEHILQFSNYCFDASVEQIFLALLNGAALFIIDNQVVKNHHLKDFIAEHKITHLDATPSYLETLPDLSEIKSLKRIIAGGEVCSLKLAERLGKNCDFYNVYGTTETTVTSTVYKYNGEVGNTPILSIGKPISNIQAYILSENLELISNGEVGELCLGGKGLAKGYLNQPELTAEKFVDNPFLPNEKMYRTGDYARWNTDGNIEFIGRKDDQVKIRGYRIELMEVEAALNSLPHIKRSVVATSNHLAGELSLVAYLQPIKTKGDSNTVRNQLGQILPEFQIPSTFMWVEKFPLTVNGKIDKKNLPGPEYIRPDSGAVLKIPQTKLEKDIARVWSEYLQIPVIDVDDNFFEMGGSSLIAQRVVGLLRKKLNTKIPLISIFEYPTISQLAEFLSENLKDEDESETISNVLSANDTASISNINPQELHNNIVRKKKTGLVINTTKAQSEILTDCFFGGDDAKRAYNISRSLKFAGKLKYDALKLAIQSLVERHESLRSSFSEDLQLMYIYPDFHVDILYHDISNQGETEKQKIKKSLISDDVNYLFDLINGPLVKFDLVKINELEHELILTVNHAICDGLSTDILLEELGVLYSAFCQDKIPTLSEPDRFSLFAEKENKFADSDEYKRSEEFWLNMYQESIQKLELPIDYPRPKLRTYNNHHLDFLLDNSLLKALKQIGNSAESNIFTSIVTTLVAAFEVFLYQQTGQNDLVLGLASSRRANYDMMQMVGHTVNLLPLRSKVDTKISFKDYLTQRNTQLFDAYDNQSISFGHLLEKLSIPRDPSRVPLVPVIINIQLDDGLESKHLFFNLSTEIKQNQNDYGTFEIEIQVFMSDEGPCFRWKYNTTLFKPETIEQMMASFKEVLNDIVANPKAKIGDIIKVDNSAYSKLNDTLVSYPKLPLHKLLTNQARISALKQAVKFGNSEISYENFEKQVNQLSHYLIEQGLKNGDFVAVSLPRSIELVITLTAIMKCGAAYLPLDPNFPSQRLEFMLEDSGARFLITTKEFSSLFKTNSKVLLSENIFQNLSQYPTVSPNISVDINEIAYLIYTSGSTGKPKGVMITHKNLVNFLYSMMLEPGIKETDKLLSITTISFDIAGLELFLPLLKGATVVIASDETAKDSRLMLELLQEESITMLQATPSTWQMLLDAGWEKPIPIKALCGGEALPMGLAKKILGRVNELWNLYGPTETTIWSSVKRILMEDDVITIGHPIANTQIYILNEQNHLVPPNTIGEICIAGDGVSKGYWNRLDLTNEKFIKNPFDTKLDTTLYRTGDLGKLLHTGEGAMFRTYRQSG
jgi:amino acid adenylation domain-containing protein